MSYAAIDTYLLRGRAPWTFSHHADHANLKPADAAPKIDYPKPDNIVSFDRNSSVYLSGTNHEENQPAHLTLKDSTVPIAHNLAIYDAPEHSVTAPQVFMKSSEMTKAIIRHYRLMLKIVFIAKPVILKIRPRISDGSRPKGVAGQTIRICSYYRSIS